MEFDPAAEDMPLIAPLLSQTDYFMPLAGDGMALSGLRDLADIATFLLDRGVGAAILTLGAQGAKYRDRSGGGFDLPAYAIDVVCSCGCGDCFYAGFATGLHLGRRLEDCVRLGQATSAQKTMSLGSQAVVSSLENTASFMENTATR